MEQLTIGLAIAALILSVVAIAFEVFFYRWQTQQGQSITDRVTGFAEKMHELLGELRGLTTRTQETQDKQFQTMLDHLVTKQAEVQADVQAETEPPVADMLQRIGHIEELVQQSPQSERLQQELSEMRSAIGTLQSVIPEVVARSVRSVSQGGGRPRTPREILRDLRDHPIIGATNEDVERTFADRYNGPMSYFVSHGFAEVSPDGGLVRLAVTDKGRVRVEPEGI